MSDSIATQSSTKKKGFVQLSIMIALEAALLISWSAGFVGVRFALDHSPIFLILLWRSLVSGLILLPIVLIKGPKLDGRAVLQQILLGVLGMAGYMSGFALAIYYGVPTGLVALIADMLPLAVAVLSWPILGQALNRKQWSGSFLGLLGVLIASGASLGGMGAPPWAYALPLLGTLSLALATLLQKRKAFVPLSIVQTLCIQCLASSAIFALFAWREGSLIPLANPAFIGGILWLVLVPTFAGYSLYYLALRRSSPARVTAVLYLSPPVTMIWAWLMFNEPLSYAMVAGLVVSLMGIVMVAKSSPVAHDV